MTGRSPQDGASSPQPAPPGSPDAEPRDAAEALRAQVEEAWAQARPLRIRGGCSKAALIPPCPAALPAENGIGATGEAPGAHGAAGAKPTEAAPAASVATDVAPSRGRGGNAADRSATGAAMEPELVDVRAHRGVVDYQPGELVITVRAGTPLAEVEALLAAHGQMLAFEPPHLGAGATVGGALACGLSGPRRPWGGSLRDALLGIVMINGRGQRLRFGGTVMKNVAGFDLARFVVGGFGRYGVLLEASFKVLPRPEAERALTLELDQAEALHSMTRWAGKPLPLSGAAWERGRLHLRLSGSTAAVRAAAAVIGGESGDGDYWQQLREVSTPALAGAERLWQLLLPPATPPLACREARDASEVIDWAGGLRWLAEGVAAGAGGGDDGTVAQAGGPSPAASSASATDRALAVGAAASAGGDRAASGPGSVPEGASASAPERLALRLDRLHRQAAAAGGHARLFALRDPALRGRAAADPRLHPPQPAALRALRQRLCAAFDPAGVFAPPPGEGD